MAKCKDFPNFKERGEWVEAQFIAQALRMGFKVLKPWEIRPPMTSRGTRPAVFQDTGEVHQLSPW